MENKEFQEIILQNRLFTLHIAQLLNINATVPGTDDPIVSADIHHKHDSLLKFHSEWNRINNLCLDRVDKLVKSSDQLVSIVSELESQLKKAKIELNSPA